MRIHTIIILGLTIFAMFFGSGNLVFPLQIGLTAESYWSIGFLGLFISGIILPFLGVFAIKRYNGSYQLFFDDLGPITRTLVPLLCLALLGAFGVVPRCITVAFGGAQVMHPGLPLWLFSGLFCLACFSIGLQDNRMISIINKFMTPVKLTTLGAIILYAIIVASPPALQQTESIDVLQNGLLQGYQTMDLFAGFFFSSLIFQHILRNTPQESSKNIVLWTSVKASLVGALAISLAYLGLVYIGAVYGKDLSLVPPTQMLPALTYQLLGTSSTLVIATCMGFSCLTTAIALNNLFAHFLHKLTQEKTNFRIILLTTTAVSFFVSLLNFKGISALLGPVLEVIYPGMIAFTVMSLLYPKFHWVKVATFYVLTALFIIYRVIF